MKYICLGYLDEKKWDALPESEQETMIEECFAYDDVLKKKLLVTVQGCFSHNEAERPHKRGQCDNDYPLHYTFSSSSMRLYARRLMSTITTAMTSVAIKPAPYDRARRCIVLGKPRDERSVKCHSDSEGNLEPTDFFLEAIRSRHGT